MDVDGADPHDLRRFVDGAGAGLWASPRRARRGARSAATGCGSCSRRCAASDKARWRTASASPRAPRPRPTSRIPLLGARLVECTRLMLAAADGATALAILGAARRPQVPLVDDAVRRGLGGRVAVRRRARAVLRRCVRPGDAAAPRRALKRVRPAAAGGAGLQRGAGAPAILDGVSRRARQPCPPRHRRADPSSSRRSARCHAAPRACVRAGRCAAAI